MTKKILILSQTAWRSDNSFGSSYTNIFKSMTGIELANIYCDTPLPENALVSRHFQMNERMLIQNLLHPDQPAGREVTPETPTKKTNGTQSFAMPIFKTLRWQIFFWLRDLIWAVGRWRSSELNAFIDDFDADILFFPLYAQNYTNPVAEYIIKRTKKPLIIYISDDIYTLKQFSLSPLYWINRFMLRKKIKRVMRHCNLLYVISDKQKQDYSRIFDIPCKVLTKGDRFIGKPPVKQTINYPIQLVYTGNIGSGRWRMLALIADSLKLINQTGIKAQLKIYSFTPITRAMKKKLNISGSSQLMGGIAAAQVADMQSQADILVHTESFALKERLKARYSFSTKLVDYFSASRCIFAIGNAQLASIDHLIQNDAAVVASDKQAVYSKLNALISNPDDIKRYAVNAWECGKNNHQIEAFTQMIKDDILKLT